MNEIYYAIIFLILICMIQWIVICSNRRRLDKLDKDNTDIIQWVRNIDTGLSYHDAKIQSLNKMIDQVLDNSKKTNDICLKTVNDIYSNLGMTYEKDEPEEIQ